MNTYEVHTDSGDVTFCIGIIGKTQQQARLPNTGVPDEEQLEQIVVSVMVVSTTLNGRSQVGGLHRRTRIPEVTRQEMYSMYHS